MTIECNARVGIAPTPIGLDGIWEFRFEAGKSIEEVSDPGFAATDAMAVPGCFDTLPKWFLKRGTALYRRDFTLPDRDQGASGIDVMASRFRERFPDKPIMLSECGVGALRGLRDPAAGFMSEEFQEEYIRDILETVEGNPDICGYAIWQMNDNRTCHRNSPGQLAKQMAGWSIAGIFDRHREPKLAVETVRSHFTRHEMQTSGWHTPKKTETC